MLASTLQIVSSRAYSIAACGIETAHTSEVYVEMLNVARIALPLAALKLYHAILLEGTSGSRAYSIAACGIETWKQQSKHVQDLRVARIALPLAAS